MMIILVLKIIWNNPYNKSKDIWMKLWVLKMIMIILVHRIWCKTLHKLLINRIFLSRFFLICLFMYMIFFFFFLTNSMLITSRGFPHLPLHVHDFLLLLPTFFFFNKFHAYHHLGFPGGIGGKGHACECRRCKRCGFDPWVGTIPWRSVWQLIPVSLPGESHGQRKLAGYGP